MNNRNIPTLKSPAFDENFVFDEKNIVSMFHTKELLITISQDVKGRLVKVGSYER
jgi:hypothetical protein